LLLAQRLIELSALLIKVFMPSSHSLVEVTDDFTLSVELGAHLFRNSSLCLYELAHLLLLFVHYTCITLLSRPAKCCMSFDGWS
jgi:hypothetical protein